jgi:hypothetical protein
MPFTTSETLIEFAEQSLERRLPEPLRLRLLRSNGGEGSTPDDDWILHPIRDASDRKRLVRTANDIIKETEQARQWRSFPQQLRSGHHPLNSHAALTRSRTVLSPFQNAVIRAISQLRFEQTPWRAGAFPKELETWIQSAAD